jgi:hypothetical protein
MIQDEVSWPNFCQDIHGPIPPTKCHAVLTIVCKQALTTLRRLTKFSSGVLKGRLGELTRIIQPTIMALRSNTSKLGMTLIQACPSSKNAPLGTKCTRCLAR